MPRLPYTRVVDVSLERRDRFATSTGFSVALIVTPDDVPGVIDATTRTKVYGDITELAVDYATGTDTYKAASSLMAQNPRPRQFKVGYRNPANPIQDELNAIYEYDPDWYWITHTAELRDTANQRLMADWVETKFALGGFDTNDPDTEVPSGAVDPTATVTITIASPGVVTWTGHGRVEDDEVVFTTTGALPTGLAAGTIYYVVAIDANTFSVSATPAGSAINTSGSQSGTHTARHPVYGGSFAEYIESKNYDRSFAFYHTDATLYPAAALIGYVATRDLDRGNLRAALRGDFNSGRAYTAKFKKLIGITAVNKGSSVVQAITGFIPGSGIQAASGHRANVYINIGGLDFVAEGSVASGAFIDEIHAGDWLVARSREELLSALTNNDRIPYTNPGVGVLTNAIDNVFRRAVAAGIIAGDIIDGGTAGTETFVPEYEITHDRVENIPAAQRRNRIAPDIQVDFRYAGAFHYVSARLIMRF